MDVKLPKIVLIVSSWLHYMHGAGAGTPLRQQQMASAAAAEPCADAEGSGRPAVEQSTGSKRMLRGMSDVKLGVVGSGDSLIWRIAAFS